ncbi:MAG: hypothetical protein M1831_006713 [Alyxoria varia]|nr:MAG: hypothetical protein M1831_006713 [Alyxoria varia]
MPPKIPSTTPSGTTSFLRHLPQQTRQYSAPNPQEVPPNKKRFVPSSGNHPVGFLTSSTHVGVKSSPGNASSRFPDLSVIASTQPCSAAAVFTQNRFQAAPVQVDRRMLQATGGRGIRGIVVNTGCANAVTGAGGVQDAEEMARVAGRSLSQTGGTNKEEESCLVMSTGVIGQRLPTGKVLAGIPALVPSLSPSHNGFLATASAITTTDTFPKLATRPPFILPSYPRTPFHLSGMTKGAGMIHPNMATLLGILLTDAPISPAALQPLLKSAVSRSFNRISIDGDTSTNDTLAILANGAAVPKASWHGEVTEGAASAADYAVLEREITALTTELAQLVVRDGEGATKFVTLRVRGASSEDVGHKVASTVSRSPLVKTALYGRDANWGRILCAVGYADGIPEGAIDPAKVSVSFLRRPSQGGGSVEQLRLLRNGEPAGFSEAKASEFLADEDLEILICLHDPQDSSAEVRDEPERQSDVLFWTCDMSHEYGRT